LPKNKIDVIGTDFLEDKQKKPYQVDTAFYSILLSFFFYFSLFLLASSAAPAENARRGKMGRPVSGFSFAAP